MSDNPVMDRDIATLPSGAQSIRVTAAKTLSLFERLVFASASDALGGSFTITLPDVGQAAGLFFMIRADILNSTTVTVQDNGNDAGFSDIVLNVDNEYVFLFSTGKEWIQTSAAGYS